MNRLMPQGARERGQVLVVFTLALVAIVAMTGLVLDGGSTFVQRRDQQNVADAAAMAGAYAYLNAGTSDAATAASMQLSNTNGYTVGTDGVAVNVSVTPAAVGTKVTVSVTKPHRNSFSGLVGFPSWDVTTTATAITGPPNAAIGAMPIIFNKKAFDEGQNPGKEKYYDEPGSGSDDVPQDDKTFNWTVFCTASGNPCNGDSNTVDDLINGHGSSQLVTTEMDIGPLNAGAHTTLFSDLAQYVIHDEDYPVAIVDDDGNFLGIAMFHLTGSVGGSTKQIRGYFSTPIRHETLRIDENVAPGTTEFGDYVVQLIN